MARYEFGPFQLDVEERLLLRGSQRVKITPKAFDVLVLLVENSGQLVTKESLKNKLWTDDEFFDDGVIAVTIAAVRKALGDRRQEQNGTQYIENIPLSGYRFLPAVKKLPDENGQPNPIRSAFDLAQTPEVLEKNQYPFNKLLIGIALGGILVLSLAAGYYLKISRKAPLGQQSQISTGTRRVVAVLAFKNLSPDPKQAWLSNAFPDWLTSELAAGGKLRMIAVEDVDRMEKDLALSSNDTYSSEILAKIRQYLGADVLIQGSYTVTGTAPNERIRLDIRTVDTSNGQMTSSLTEIGNKADILDFVARVGAELREKLGLMEISSTDTAATQALLPRNQAAAQLYIDGITKLHEFDPDAAVKLLEGSVQASPEYPLAHSALATAWSALGYETKAHKEAQTALDFSATLPREEYLAIEANYRQIDKDWPKAIHLYETLWTFSPDNLEYGIQLARAQISAGKSQDALATIQTMRNSNSQGRNDPRIDLAEAKAAESLGDFQREQAAAERAAATAKTMGARYIQGIALLMQGWALDNLGQFKQALDVDEQAKRIFEGMGDRADLAWAEKNIADVYSDDGHLNDAVKAYQQALVIYRGVGNQTGMAVTLNNMAFVLKDQGNLPAARQMFGQSLTISRDAGDRARQALALNGMGIVLWREGDLTAATKVYEETLAIYKGQGDKSRYEHSLTNLGLILEDQGRLKEAKQKLEECLSIDREIGDKTGISRALGNIGDVLLREGELLRAQSNYKEADKISQDIGNKHNRAYALSGLGDVLLLQGNLVDARTNYEQALKLRQENSEQGLVAESQLSIAELEIEEGKPPEAESRARAAAEQFKNENEGDQEALAFATLSSALLSEGKVTEAQAAVETSLQLSSKTEDRGARLRIMITAARVHDHIGKTQDAIRELKTALSDSIKFGYLESQFEAQLALAQAEMDAGNAAAGRASLQILEQHARNRGFLLIAKKVASFLRQQAELE